MDAQATTRPFARLDIEEMRAALPGISGGALKVWLAYLLRANRDGIAWPGAKVLAEDTGLSASRVSRLRSELIDAEWLVPVGCTRGAHGTFGSPRFRPVIPQIHRAAKTAHGGNTARRELDSPHAENDSHRAAKTAHEVVPLKKNQNEVKRSANALPPAESGMDFENLKLYGKDLRFESVKSFYVAEFEKRNPGVTTPFDGSDGTALKRLLTQQGQATAETIIAWLRSAFESGDAPPLRPGFRLREFCSHATKYTAGPLGRARAANRAPVIESGDPEKFSEVAL